MIKVGRCFVNLGGDLLMFDDLYPIHLFIHYKICLISYTVRKKRYIYSAHIVVTIVTINICVVQKFMKNCLFV